MDTQRLLSIAISPLLLVPVLCLLCGCTITHEYKSKSAVKVYREYDSIYLGKTDKEEEFRLVFCMNLESCRQYDFFDTGKEAEVFDSLCAAHGDVGFNRVFEINDGTPVLLEVAVTPDPVFVDVVTEKDFDDSHAAGESLRDIVTCQYKPYYEYIRNDYTWRGKKIKKNYYEHVYYFLGNETKRLSSMNEDDYKLWQDVIPFRLIKKPSSPGDYPVKVTLHTEKGDVFESCIVLSFD